MQSSPVQVEKWDLWLIKDNFDLSVFESAANYLNHLRYRLIDIRKGNGGDEASLLDYSLVEQVVCMHHEQLCRDEYRLGHLLLHLVLDTSVETHGQL